MSWDWSLNNDHDNEIASWSIPYTWGPIIRRCLGMDEDQSVARHPSITGREAEIMFGRAKIILAEEWRTLRTEDVDPQGHPWTEDTLDDIRTVFYEILRTSARHPNGMFTFTDSAIPEIEKVPDYVDRDTLVVELPLISGKRTWVRVADITHIVESEYPQDHTDRKSPMISSTYIYLRHGGHFVVKVPIDETRLRVFGS